MFKRYESGAYMVVHPTTEVPWIAYSIEKAIALYAYLNNISFREALLKYERC
jgi:hypothetical protein